MTLPRDVLLRIGGRTLTRTGRVAVYGYSRGQGQGVVPTFTRSGDAPYFDRDGRIKLASANILRKSWVDLDGDGIRETCTILPGDGARTNVALHNRDLTITHQLAVSGGAGTFTNGETVTAGGGGTGTYILANSTSAIFAIRGGSGTFSGTLTGGTSGATRTIGSSAAVWTKTNMTASKNQPGIDGVSNSATTIEATAGNGTILQAITLASSARYQSVYVQRRIGAGTIQMTTDNGSTWTAITVTNPLSTPYVRVTIPTQTLANPTVGFRIVTSGDSINVDGFQNENGLFPSSVILTTTAAGARGADALTLPVVNFGPSRDLTVLVRIARPAYAEIASLGIIPRIWMLGPAGVAGEIGAFFDSSGSTISSEIVGATTGATVTSSIPAGTELAIATQFRTLTTNPQVLQDVGSGYGSAGTAVPGFLSFGSQTLTVGDQLFGGLIDLIIAAGRETRADMMALL